MCKYFGLSLLLVAFLSFLVWLLAKWVQPALPSAIRSPWVLLATILVAVVGLLSQFKSVVELFHSIFSSPPSQSDSTVPGTLITGPVHVVHGNVTVNVTYVVQNPLPDQGVDAEPSVATGPPVPGPVVFQAPSLPRVLAGRSAEITAVKRFLLQTPGTVALTSLVGMGGIGKTVLAAAVAHDAEVQQAFPGGILWACVRDQELSDVLTSWIRSLDPGSPYDGSGQSNAVLLQIFRQRLEGRRILVVLDDIDERSVPYVRMLGEHLGEGCRALITSRLVNPGTDNVLSLDVLPESESLKLFERRLGRALTPEETEIARDVAFLCGHLPLALTLVSAMLQRGSSLEDVRKRMKDAVKATEATSVDQIRSRSASLDASLKWTYERLTAVEQKRFRALSLLVPPHDVFALEGAAALWSVSADEAAQTLDRLVTLSLLSEKRGRYRMHDLVRSFAAQMLGTTDPKEQEEARRAFGAMLRSPSEEWPNQRMERDQ